MSEKNQQPIPIRIVKKKGGHGGHHGGAWKVAYADFVTAMMALFIVLWIVGQSKAIKQSVAGYFKDPGVFETTKGGLVSGQGAAESQPAGMNVTPPAMTPPAPKPNTIVAQKIRLEETAEAIKRELKLNPNLTNLLKQVEFEILPEGLRLELVETPDSFFFNVGTANLTNGMKQILGVIAHEIKKLPNRIIIEGHTDSRQYPRSDGYTNFELSADRANAARRIMIQQGINPKQIEEIRGCADTHLRNPKDPLDATNRRISILIKYYDNSGK